MESTQVLKRAGALYDFYAYYCARAATWIVTTLEGVDGSCTGYVLWAAADRRVSVADVSGGFAAAASAAVTCDAATACAPGSQLEVAGTSLDWGGSDGTRLPTNYLDGVYFESDVANDGLATYASETVDGLKIVPCGEKWHIAFGESPCDVAAGIVLGFVASPGLGGGGTVATNRQVDGCAEGVYPCLYDAVEGASATCTGTQGEKEEKKKNKNKKNKNKKAKNKNKNKKAKKKKKKKNSKKKKARSRSRRTRPRDGPRASSAPRSPPRSPSSCEPVFPGRAAPPGRRWRRVPQGRGAAGAAHVEPEEEARASLRFL